MQYFIDEEFCDRCLICVSACPCGAIQVDRDWLAVIDLVRTGEGAPLSRGAPIMRQAMAPEIDQDLCDGDPTRLVPPCIAVCDIGAIQVNMLV